jgi:hypothetical protein
MSERGSCDNNIDKFRKKEKKKTGIANIYSEAYQKLHGERKRTQ